MKVGELIELLKDCNPNEEIRVIGEADQETMELRIQAGPTVSMQYGQS